MNNVQDLDSALWAHVSHADSGFGPNGEHASGLGAEATMTGTAPRYIGR